MSYVQDYRGGTASFNQAQFQMIRLHELMTTVNECWVNFGGLVDDLPAHQMLFNVLQAYFLEIESTFKEAEAKEISKQLENIERLINQNSIWNLNSNQTLGGSNTKKEINYTNYFTFRSELRKFQMIILQNAQKHGIGNPTKKNPSRAVLN